MIQTISFGNVVEIAAGSALVGFAVGMYLMVKITRFFKKVG